MDNPELRDDPPNPGELPKYLSPYEFWNFGKGKGYAFPGIRKFPDFISALAELGSARRRATDDGPDGDEFDGADEADSRDRHKGRLPTLWKPGEAKKFVPFVVDRPFDEIESPDALQKALQQALRGLRSQLPPGIRGIRRSRFRVAFPIPNGAMKDLDKPDPPYWEKDPGLRNRIGDKRITIMAVIDDGLPFAHRNFRDAGGKKTRVEFCWLQSVDQDPAQTSVLFGREYTREDIEGLIEEYGDDEDTLYRAAGATTDSEEFPSMISRHASHGGHVMDLATGYAAERGDEPKEEIRIIAVQLPNTIALDTSGFGKDMYMLSAFHYIFDRAEIIARKEGYDIDKARLVINFSYGFSGGRHDGETELEAAIEELVAMRRKLTGPTALVLPAGNLFLDRLHGVIDEDDFEDGAASFPWRLQANDRTPSYLEIWFAQTFNPVGYVVELWDPSDNCRVSLEIGSDSAEDDGDPRRVCAILNDKDQDVGQISADLHRADDRRGPEAEKKTGRWRVLVVMAPSEPENDCLPGIEAGKWTVVIRQGSGRSIEGYPIHCWIQRDSDPEMLRSGSRQSYFDDLKDCRYERDGSLRELDTEDAFIRRFGSLNGLATGEKTLIVAGFRLGLGLGSSLEDVRPAPYSSAGPYEPDSPAGTTEPPSSAGIAAGASEPYGPAGGTTESYRPAETDQHDWPEASVDCSSMSDRSKVLAGTVAAGVRSGSRSFVQGTSAAAPFVARRLAEIFVTADKERVCAAECQNYLPLLQDITPGPHADAKPDSQPDPRRQEDPLIARLGLVRVAPHWQPGIQRDMQKEPEAHDCQPPYGTDGLSGVDGSPRLER